MFDFVQKVTGLNPNGPLAERMVDLNEQENIICHTENVVELKQSTVLMVAVLWETSTFLLFFGFFCLFFPVGPRMFSISAAPDHTVLD